MTFIIFNKRGRDGGAHDGAHERALHTRKVAVGRWVPSGHHTMRAAEHEGWRVGATWRAATCGKWGSGCDAHYDAHMLRSCAGIGWPFACATWGAAGWRAN